MSYSTKTSHARRRGDLACRASSVSRKMFGALLAATMLLGALTFVATATATSNPAWSLTATSQATNFAAGAVPAEGAPQYMITARNAGGAATSGTVTITDTLPAGVTAKEPFLINVQAAEQYSCSISGQTVACTYAEPIQPGQFIRAYIPVEVSEGASGVLIDQATVSGGGIPDASTTVETPVSASDATWGFLPGSVGFGGSITEADGSAATQAGSHPYALTVTATFPTAVKREILVTDGHLRDIKVDLPPGVIVNPTATSVRCTEAQLETDIEGPGCPLASQVGVIDLSATAGRATTQADALFNMVPPAGKPAEFGFDAAAVGVYVHLLGGVNTGSDYALSASSSDILAKLTITGVQATFWGNPSDPSHDTQRGNCSYGGITVTCPASIPPSSVPLLTMPSACGSSLTLSGSIDSWEEPGVFKDVNAQLSDLPGVPLRVSGCARPGFTPSISVMPESSAADSPTGLHVDLRVPQSESLGTLATANLKDAVVALPAGVTVNASAASGLVACSPVQIEINGPEPAACPDASKIGAVSLETPLLEHPLPGAIYLAAQNENPFGSLLAVYIAVDDPQTGVVIKLAGKVAADPVTGQLTATFDENPQLPFEDMKLDFFGGERATLATPETCGQYGASASFTSWAQPENPVAPVVQPFAISRGPGGAACGSAEFTPTMVAGTASNQAGSYSPFVTSLRRKDGEQRFGAVSLKLPAGMEGMISHVTPCGEAQADAGTCPVSSQLGRVSVQAGVGGEPDTLPEAGRQEDPVYLTTGYGGAPFGLSIVVHAEAGPFNLGTVVVRGRILVDPVTAQVSVVTDALGPYAIPTILQGIPVDVQAMNIEVDRSQFMFNPTSCEAMSATGTIGSSAGASAAVSSHYQAAGCASLPFAPRFSASTGGKASKAQGASLLVKIASKGGAGTSGEEANIKSVKVELPKQLPSRLTTLQKACAAAQFEANPAGCPKESDVGTATASTPILANPLSGPAYLVSHGGAAFPDLEIVLQGEGITLILDGQTDIKKGITSSTFKTVPDAPISSFELNLPTGSYSILSAYLPANANYNLCGQKLSMPTSITGQNGATVTQSTPITVTGCSTVLSVTHTVKKGTVTLSVYAPAGGKITASGRGLTTVTKTAKSQELVTVTLKQKKTGKLKTSVKVTFKPGNGKKQTKAMKLTFKK